MAPSEAARLVVAAAVPPRDRARRRGSGPVEEGGLAAGKSAAAACNGWIVFEDEAGQSMAPPRVRTWGRTGCTTVVRVRARGSGPVSMAGMACYKPGEPCRLIYAVRECTGRKDQPKGFGWRDFRDLLVRTRMHLGGPIVLVWDNVRIHPPRPCAGPSLRTTTGSPYSNCPPTHPISTRLKACGPWSSATWATSQQPIEARSPEP